MGTDVSIVVHGAGGVDPGRSDPGRMAADLLERLEAKWSRFRPTSELSRLNAAGGAWTVVSPETFDLVTTAVEAWRDTGGRFDPTVLPALVAAGYDRDFADVPADGPAADGPTQDGRSPVGPAPGCEGIQLDATVGSVRLPVGVELDLGGIGKGRAADLVARALRGAGARGVLVDLGGDVRVEGETPRAEGWLIEVDDHLGTGETGRLSIASGAVATSTRLRRAWTRGGRPLHHLIDPRTGEPASTGLASVTVVAGSACRAEVLAKAAFVAGPDEGADLLARARVTGLLVHDDGRVVDLPGLEPFRS
jgi:thiamine biosynthesis lipoprotein